MIYVEEEEQDKNSEILMHMREGNNEFLLKYRLDVEIERLQLLMMEVPDKGHTDVRREVNSRRKMTIQEYISRINGKLQNKVWKPGRLKVAIAEEIEQQHEEERLKDQQQNKV